MHRSVHSISLGTYFPININLRNAEMDFFFYWWYIFVHRQSSLWDRCGFRQTSTPTESTQAETILPSDVFTRGRFAWIHVMIMAPVFKFL